MYVIRNTVNGKTYVGSTTVGLRRRLRHHWSALNRGAHRNSYLQNAWDKYGQQAFIAEVLELDPLDVVACEQLWMDALQPAYNISRTADVVSGYRFTAEQRARVSAALKGKPKSAEHRANIWANRQVTDEVRELMAANGRMGRGKPKTAEHRAKIGLPQRGSGNHQAKLTEDDVRDIKRRVVQGERGCDLAAEFKVSPACIRDIAKGRRWGHIVV